VNPNVQIGVSRNIQEGNNNRPALTLPLPAVGEKLHEKELIEVIEKAII
jgi:hypothetical protein